MSFSAVILAGGQSRRMGRDKAFLSTHGQTLLARQLQTLRAAGAAELFISGRADVDYSSYPAHFVRDRFPDVGPLAGIEAALTSATHSRLLVLAVDLPEMPADWLRQMLSDCTDTCSLVPTIHGLAEPLAAVYPRTLLALVQQLLRDGKFALRHFVDCGVQAGQLRLREVAAAETRYFTNWNTPADYHPQPAAGLAGVH
jgi:molybdenum cofactor guanylyltransferase